MNTKRLELIALTWGIVMLVGCGGGEPARPAASPKPVVNAPPPPPPPPPAPAAAPAAKAPKMVRQKAEEGVGAKGRGYGRGIITTPVAEYFHVRERIAFDIQIPHAMQLFKSLEGHVPKTEEEFMEKIIKANGIKLPQLPEGHRYLYNPETEQLMVERPASE